MALGKQNPRGSAERPAEGHRARGTGGSIRARTRKWLYRGQRVGFLARAINHVQAAVNSAGISPSRLATLEVRGRKSGRIIAFPIVIADYEGDRYLVAMLGEKAEWVRNVAAAGGSAVLRHGRREKVHLEVVPCEDRAPILRRYLECARGARAHVPVDHRAPLSEFRMIATTMPVFKIIPVS